MFCVLLGLCCVGKECVVCLLFFVALFGVSQQLLGRVSKSQSVCVSVCCFVCVE